MPSSIQKDLIHALRQQSLLRKTVLILAATGAIAAAGLQVLYPDPQTVPRLVPVVQLTGLVFSIIFPLILVVFDETTVSIATKYQRLEKEADDLTIDLENADQDVLQLEGIFLQSTRLYQEMRAISELVDPVLIAEPNRVKDVANNSVETLLEYLVSSRTQLLQMEDENWTLGVYVWTGRQLEMRAARRWSRPSEQQTHRIWNSGEGHVGQAFKARREMVCADANDPTVAGFLAANTDKGRSSDQSTYVSFASVPIIVGNADMPLGVLVATSNVVGRFKPSDSGEDLDPYDNIEPLRFAASTLATLLSLTDDSLKDSVASHQETS